MRFRDRKEAGEKLAGSLLEYRGEDAVVYALPRGGVILGYKVAERIGAPLDVLIMRKIGHPGNPEYALCAISEGGEIVCTENELRLVDDEWFSGAVEKEKKEAKRRKESYLKGRAPISAKGKIAIIVDDGVATGLTLRGAIAEIKKQNPTKIVVAVPVAPMDTADLIKKEVDDLIVLDIPANYLGAVGAYYDEFPQVDDEEVIEILARDTTGVDDRKVLG